MSVSLKKRHCYGDAAENISRQQNKTHADVRQAGRIPSVAACNQKIDRKARFEIITHKTVRQLRGDFIKCHKLTGRRMLHPPISLSIDLECLALSIFLRSTIVTPGVRICAHIVSFHALCMK